MEGRGCLWEEWRVKRLGAEREEIARGSSCKMSEEGPTKGMRLSASVVHQHTKMAADWPEHVKEGTLPDRCTWSLHDVCILGSCTEDNGCMKASYNIIGADHDMQSCTEDNGCMKASYNIIEKSSNRKSRGRSRENKTKC